MRRAVLAVLGLVLLVVTGIGGGLAWWLRRDGPRPELLIQRADGNLALVAPDGQTRTLTSDSDGRLKLYAHPVPSPDGRGVAYVETVHGTNAVTSSLVVHRLRGERRTVFESVESRPFYLHWSPDGAQIAFLASDPDGMVLRSVNTVGRPVAQHVVLGDPSYFSWTPDGQRLLLHTGGSAPAGSLSVWSLGDTEPRKLAAEPALFQAPAWLDNGQVAVAAVPGGEGVALARLATDGTTQQQVASSDGGMIFVVAPDGGTIGYLTLSNGILGRLRLVGADGTGDREIAHGPVLTFLWSPDGKRIAYLTAADADDARPVAWRAQIGLRLTWNVHDLASGETRALGTFEPSDEFINVLPFFDQYAQSIRLWDTAGKRLVYADQKGVWTLDVDTGEASKAGEGVMGMWLER